MSWFKTEPKKFINVKVGRGRSVITQNNGTRYYVPITGFAYSFFKKNDDIHTAKELFNRRYSGKTCDFLNVGNDTFIPVSSIKEIIFDDTEPDYSIEVEE